MADLGDEFLVTIAEEFYGFPVDAWLDQYCAVQEYLFQGQSELDCLMDKINIGAEDPREILKFRGKKVDFTR